MIRRVWLAWPSNNLTCYSMRQHALARCAVIGCGCRWVSIATFNISVEQQKERLHSASELRHIHAPQGICSCPACISCCDSAPGGVTGELPVLLSYSRTLCYGHGHVVAKSKTG
jgi:hypothetical protein